MLYIMIRYVFELKETLIIYIREFSVSRDSFDREIYNKNYLTQNK
jgi:hypothetical protein